MVHGRIFDLQRCSLHDGPGIRTTVFLKGCPLRCRWCHNPESQAPGPELAFDAARCTACAACVPACPHGAHRFVDGHRIDRDACVGCAACVPACPQGALRIHGRDAGVDEILATVVRDRAYYARSGGGMTISGGEPLAQPAFAAALAAGARAQGIHVAVETSGHAAPAALERVLPHVDLWLVDWKCSDEARHRELTGVGHERIRASLQRIAAAGAPLRLRCPLIPGLNDDAGHLQGIAALARELRPQRVELMAYHDLGLAKAGRIGRATQCARGAATPQQVEGWIGALAAQGCVAVAG